MRAIGEPTQVTGSSISSHLRQSDLHSAVNTTPQRCNREATQTFKTVDAEIEGTAGLLNINFDIGAASSRDSATSRHGFTPLFFHH